MKTQLAIPGVPIYPNEPGHAPVDTSIEVRKAMAEYDKETK